MSILSQRSNRTDDFLKGKFIKSKLEETSKEIDKLQRKETSSFSSSFWNNRVFTVSENTMVLTHDKRQRYLDMKTRAKKDGTKKKKKSHPIHNKIIMSQYSYLTRELAFGFTEEVKNNLKKLEE